MAGEGFDTFSARYPPHYYSLIQRSRCQILSVWRKYYTYDSIRVASEGLMRSPFDAFHTPISIKDPDAKFSPFCENTTFTIQLELPVRVLIRSPFDTLHTPIVLSKDPDAKFSVRRKYQASDLVRVASRYSI